LYPGNIARKSQAQSEMKKQIKANSYHQKRPESISSNMGKIKFPRTSNPIKMKKYLGGKNIKIGRAQRFKN